MKDAGIRIEGGLLSADVIEAIRTGEAPGQKGKDFGFGPRERLEEIILGHWTYAKRLWGAFGALKAIAAEDRATTLTRERWLIPLLSDVLGYSLEYQRTAAVVGHQRYAISHRAGTDEGAVPVHLVGWDTDLDRRNEKRQERRSPQSLIQDYLNRTDNLWGLLSNGLKLRLVRQNLRITRPMYVEFDLEAIFEGDRFETFVLLYRLAHRSRFDRTDGNPASSWIEQYAQITVANAHRVRDRMQAGVKAAIEALGRGFLRHPQSAALRQALDEGRLTAQDLYQQLLRLVYRLIFLLVAEERHLLHPNPKAREAQIYAAHYSLRRLRELAQHWRKVEGAYGDRWQGLVTLLRTLAEPGKNNPFSIAPLNGDLFGPNALPDLEAASISNRDLLEALWHLTTFNDEGVRRRVDFAALDAEEIGSIYEGLLAYAPVVNLKGGEVPFQLVAKSEERNRSASHYTDSALVKEILDHALTPVIQERLSQAGPDRQARRAAVLSIRVCDPACGSGHFLLEAARRLGRELARIETGEDEPTPQAFRRGVREAIRHCIYGVDKNPLAVELCKVALWIEGHCEGEPLSFLDHRIRCGDSLVGITDLEVLADGIPDAAYQPKEGDQQNLAQSLRDRNREERAGQMAVSIGAVPPAETVVKELSNAQKIVGAMSEATANDVRAKAAAYAKQREPGTPWWRVWTAANLWTAPFWMPLTRATGGQVPTTHDVRACLAEEPVRQAAVDAANRMADELRFFHWPVEFPEVFAEGGFDVIVGNPPFLGGTRISTVFGNRYRHWLVTQVAGAKTNRADLCAFFFRRAFGLLRPGGRMGMLATNTISQGDTRQAGLEPICRQGGTIVWAVPNRPWPGDAVVHIAEVVIVHGESTEPPMLDYKEVPVITPFLDDGTAGAGNPVPLHNGMAYEGVKTRGSGFLLTPEQAHTLIQKDPRNADCLFPYLTGEDLNKRPDHLPSRWVIDFHDWPLERAKEYPDLFHIIEQKVKPKREKVKQDAHRRYWWQFADRRPAMYAAIWSLPRVLVACIVTKHWALVFAPTNPRTVFSNKTVVFALSTWDAFSLLQSSVHELWARKYSSTLETRLNYAQSDCFDTFPFPPKEAISQLEAIGEAYYTHRENILQARNIGLTDCYNTFHDPECTDDDIVQLRELHQAMDQQVVFAYGWTDLALQHGFYPHRVTGEVRFTLEPEQQAEILRRLLALNHELAEKNAGQPHT
ncbi:Eco57I restriction-modification methylase domain-containing protein [Thermaerobacter litoralis]